MNIFEKISAQQGAERTAVWMAGEQLKDIIRNDARAQEIVSQDLDVPEMSIAECEKKIKAYADSHKTGNFACVTPVEAEYIIRRFYGIKKRSEAPLEDASAPLTLDSFF